MDLICRICQQSKVEELILISSTAARQRERICDMIGAVIGSSVEEYDRLPQHVCSACFGQLERTYRLWKLCRGVARREVAHQKVQNENRCRTCCALTDGESCKKWDTDIDDMFQHLSGALIEINDNRHSWLLCKSCLVEMDAAYEFKGKCIESEASLLESMSFMWEKMEVDACNWEQLVIDLYAEAVQEQGRLHCSVCLLEVEMQQLGKKCEGCMLQFRNYDEIQSVQASVRAEENHSTSPVEIDSVWVEENLSHEFIDERDEEYLIEDDVSCETNSEVDIDNDIEITELNNKCFVYIGNSKTRYEIFEKYPDDPFPKARRTEPFCCKCMMFFDTKLDLEAHTKRSHQKSTGRGEFSCDVCLSLFTDPQSLEFHKTKLQTFFYDFCKSCKIVLSSPYLLLQHKKKFHVELETVMSTSEQNTRAAKESDLTEVEINCKTEVLVRYDCCVRNCCNRYSSEEQLLKHLNTAHFHSQQILGNACQYCKVKFPNETALLEHCNRKVESQKPHIRSSNKHNKKPSTKSLPLDLKHFSVVSKMDKNTDILKRKCELCCKCFLLFDSKEELTAHCQQHSTKGGQPFHCQVCGRGFLNQSAYTSHRDLTEKPIHYFCRVCEKMLWTKFDCIIHRAAVHFPEDMNAQIASMVDAFFTCCGCKKPFGTEAELVEHRRTKHQPPPASSSKPVLKVPKCDHCHMCFTKPKDHEKHITLYESKMTYRCKLASCAFKTNDIERIRQHIFGTRHQDAIRTIVRSADPSEYACCILDCEFRCHDYDAMIKHGRATHAQKREYFSVLHSDRKFKCPVCGKGFVLEILLINHKNSRQTYHCRGCELNVPREERSSHVQCVEKPKVKCEICEKLVASEKGLRYHVKTVHSNESEKHVCKICGKKFVRLAVHMQSHKNERNWVCKICAARFNHINLLRNHRRVHMNESVYTCRHGCKKHYKTPGDRDRHERLVHLGITPFRCEFCEASFIRLKDLRLHQRKHTGLQLYPCPHCDAGFNKKSEYDDHCKQCKNSVL
ncbi:zinc finger protein 808-like [Ochlerotatus camptorhynchus]|uniref:zinc finger protein 808-like n=1 Tax=Ochlerotatus camptorhynchus TaxID=644619 RepID=UPI0031DBB08C